MACPPSRAPRRGAWLAACVLLAPLACISIVSAPDDGDWRHDGERSACSTGPAATLGTPLPVLPADARPSGPECVPRCGVEKGTYPTFGYQWPVAALPSGACSYEGEVCLMGAVSTLDCPPQSSLPVVACSLSSYACRCEGGAWRCYVWSRGASACVCPLLPDGAPWPALYPDGAPWGADWDGGGG